jgi:hypothetical protein
MSIPQPYDTGLTEEQLAEAFRRALGDMTDEEIENAIATAINLIPKGLVYMGAYNYFSELPTNAKEGEVYTVKYKSTSGTEPDGNEYAWGKYEGTLQWIPLGVDSYTKKEIDEQHETIKSDILSVANNVTTTNAKAGTSTTNTLSSVGWHRIFAAERQQFARSGILMINRAFGSREPESHTILFNITQGSAVLELLNKNVEKQSISKLRLVHAKSSPQSKACYIDIYYNETGENKIMSSVFCESIVTTGAGSSFMNSRFVASNLSADIPEGYTSTELSLTNGDFSDRLTALETALSQTTTVSE